MRIVVTKNGTKVIEDLSPNNSIDNSSDIYQNSNDMINFRLKQLKKNKSYNKISNLKNMNKNITQSLSNLKNDIEHKDINDILKSINSNESNQNNGNNLNINNLKIIKIKNNKKVKLPKLLEERYIFFDTINIENVRQNHIPNILLSINNSIDKDIMKEKIMKRTKTLSKKP